MKKTKKAVFFRSFLMVRLGQMPQNERYKLIFQVRSELARMLYIGVRGLQVRSLLRTVKRSLTLRV